MSGPHVDGRLWTFQRLLYALEPRDHYYGAPGAQWPAPFQSVMDLLAALAFVAAHTRTIRLGVCVLIMPIYQPVRYAEAGVTQIFLEPDFQPGGTLERGRAQLEALAPQAK